MCISSIRGRNSGVIAASTWCKELAAITFTIEDISKELPRLSQKSTFYNLTGILKLRHFASWCLRILHSMNHFTQWSRQTTQTYRNAKLRRGRTILKACLCIFRIRSWWLLQGRTKSNEENMEVEDLVYVTVDHVNPVQWPLVGSLMLIEDPTTLCV